MFKRKKEDIYSYLTKPSKPWLKSAIIPASGIIAGGWTNDNQVFLYSSDGYSVSNPLTGELLFWNKDLENTARKKFSTDNLEFQIDELNQKIKVFGLRGGNGNHVTSDKWNLDSFTPGLGEQIVGLQNYRELKNLSPYWKNFQLIKLERLEYFTLTYGFSPNEKHFGIFGSGGAEIFSRH